MEALVYHGPGARTWESVPDPRIEETTDVIVRIDAVTLCGTDLHILRGDVPEVPDGTILGHEAVGEVMEAGRDVRTVRPGDRVLVSCITACGRCRFCRQGQYGQCTGGGGWILGHTVNGVQAQYARVPYADMSVYPLPSGVDAHDAVLLADIFPTSFEVGVRNGGVGPNDTVVVVGAGPIGLATVITARLFSPARVIVVDSAAARLDAAKAVGADVTVDAAEGPEPLISDLTSGLGADVAIEAVGLPETFELCTRVIRPGGRVANVGVHGAPAPLHLEDLWIKDITITTGLVDTSSTPMLLSMLASRRLPVDGLVTHSYDLGEMDEAYRTFSEPAATGALKVVLTRDHSR